MGSPSRPAVWHLVEMAYGITRTVYAFYRLCNTTDKAADEDLLDTLWCIGPVAACGIGRVEWYRMRQDLVQCWFVSAAILLDCRS